MSIRTKIPHALAAEARAWFETTTRPDGVEYWRTKHGRPDWVTDLCRAAHDGMLPDDHKYAFIVEALDYLSDEGNDPDEYAPEADVYTSDLLAWLSSNVTRSGYVDQARSYGLMDAITDLNTQIAIGQVEEKREVFTLVLRFLGNRNED